MTLDFILTEFYSYFLTMEGKHIMKYSSIVISLLALSLCQAAHATRAKDHVYLGGGLGMAVDTWKNTTTNLSTGNASSGHTTGNNAIGNLFLGYGYTTCKGWYLGGELGTTFPRRGTTSSYVGVLDASTPFSKHSYVQDYLTADILPGYRINEKYLGYLRLGASYSHLSFQQLSVPGTAFDSYSQSNNKVGARFGAGTSITLTEHIGAALDYTYTTYPSMSSTWASNNAQFKQSLYSNYVGLSVIFSI